MRERRRRCGASRGFARSGRSSPARSPPIPRRSSSCRALRREGLRRGGCRVAPAARRPARARVGAARRDGGCVRAHRRAGARRPGRREVMKRANELHGAPSVMCAPRAARSPAATGRGHASSRPRSWRHGALADPAPPRSTRCAGWSRASTRVDRGATHARRARRRRRLTATARPARGSRARRAPTRRSRSRSRAAPGSREARRA